MDHFDDDPLLAELRELRPTPRPEFTAEFDERAAAGFPRRMRPSTTSLPFALLADRWREASVRGRLMPVLAVALAALVVATGVVALSQSGGRSTPLADSISGTAGAPGSSGVPAEEATSAGAESAAPSHANAPKHGNSHPGYGGGGKSAGETVYEPEVPSLAQSPRKFSKSSGFAEAGKASEAEGGEAEAEGAEETSSGAESGESEAVESEGAYESEPEVAAPSTSRSQERDIERSSDIVLGTKPDEVATAAAKVYEAVHAANGSVLRSSVHSGDTGATGATFALMIPTAKVDDALASISQIAEVRERHDATMDITAPTVSANEELRDSNATIEGLVKELGDAETEAERESVEQRLREERRHHAAIRASLDNLHQRASLSEVSVRIVTSKHANAGPPAKGSSDGSWGVGDALHDAGHILTIAAGIVLIALAILAPIALILLLIWLAARFRVRRLRERTLG
jgi:Domain of unknown function (DUF4349)